MENFNRNRCSNNEGSFVSGVFKHRIGDRAELGKALANGDADFGRPPHPVATRCTSRQRLCFC